jgi:hypothetical protein
MPPCARLFLTRTSPARFPYVQEGTSVEIQFSPQRLNDAAGDPYWVDLTIDEAQALLAQLQAHLARAASGTTAPLVFSLEGPSVQADIAPARTSKRRRRACRKRRERIQAVGLHHLRLGL